MRADPPRRPSRRQRRRAPRQYAHTEATRLLSAGTHLNAAFRRRVVEELVGHAERPVAPPLGADVLPVLAHALRARRDELVTALLLLAVWAGFLVTDAVLLLDALEDRAGGDAGLTAGDIALLPFGTEAAGAGDTEPGGGLGGMVPGGWALAYALVVLLLWCARTVAGRDTGVGAPLRPVPLPAALAWLRRRFGGLLTYTAWAAALAYAVAAVEGITDTPYPVIFPLLIAAVVWRHTSRRTRTLRAQLARQTFAETEQPRLPARYGRIERCIRREQDASLTLYDVNRPFVGAGAPREPWSVVLELKRAADEGDGAPAGANGGVPRQQTAPVALTADDVITMIEPRLQDLRTSAAATSRDRLRQLEIEEFVYLPAGVGRDEEVYTGEGARRALVYGRDQADRHLDESAGEGGEARRHFLRIRVGAWNEQVVVSLLVRVHTQGGMLVLEVVPHVLGPVRAEFRAVDGLVGGEPEGPLRTAARACVTAPAHSVALGITALRWLPSLGTALRLWLTAPEADPHPAPAGAAGVPRRLGRLLRHGAARLWPEPGRAPDAPLVSLRQLAATDELSLFQEMDVARYTRTLQDRIGEGVRDALREGGYRTDRLEQHITQINSGVYIKEMSGGALATGTHGRATHTDKTPA
ncbi:hypothetical protein [Streptomyces sp. NPDC017941]|uniref:hypothetical protein n=1 Tax=Streptomyces sp. NPDC017941 TaxID=3365018 RepID=UPI0037AB8646